MKVETKNLPVVPPVEFVITLTQEEANDLSDICGCLLGDVSQKKTTDRLYLLLRQDGTKEHGPNLRTTTLKYNE